MLQEYLWNRVPEVPQAQRQQKRMIKETKVCMIKKLVQEPRTPVSSVGLKLLGRPRAEVGRFESMDVRHACFQIHLERENFGVL